MFTMLFIATCILSLLIGMYIGDNSNENRIDNDASKEKVEYMNTIYVYPCSDKVINHNFHRVGHETKDGTPEQRVS